MGIKNIQKSDLQGAPQNTKEFLELYPGEQKEVWEELENVRIQYEENYQFIKLRGGTSEKHSFGSKIITLYPFTSPVNGTKKDYLAVHTAAGDVYLCERETHLDPASPPTPPKILTAAFSTDQVEFLVNGKILYAFDVINNVYKVYDIELDESFDWLNNLSDSITGYTWNELGDWRDKNIWGYEVGSDIIGLHSFSDGIYTDPLNVVETFEAFVTKISDITSSHIAYEDPGGTARRTSDNAELSIMPNNPDLEPFIGVNGTLRVNEAGTVEANEDYEPPFLYRGYVIIDLLIDGSYAPPGRPVTVLTSAIDATQRRRTSINFTISAAQSNVVKRLLFCTRWQQSENKVFDPSNEKYDNSAFFFAREIENGSTSFIDRTPDEKLFSPISGYIPLRSGVNQTFFLQQLEPHSATSIESAMLIGGYVINRPIPVPYNDNANASKGNSFISIGGGSPLSIPSEVSLMFEYTDGKKSNVVDSGYELTDASAIRDEADSGTPAEVTIWITGVPTSSGAVEVADSNNLSDSGLFYYSGGSGSEIQSGIINAINSDLALPVTAFGVFDSGSGNYGVRIEYDSPGIIGNGTTLKFTYSVGVNIDDDTSGIYEVTLSGGDEPFEAISQSANVLILHSLNALVSKVYVLIQVETEEGGTPGTDPVAAQTPAIRALNQVAENSSPGDVTVTYEGNVTNVTLNPFQTLAQMAQSFVNAVNNDPNALMSAVFESPNKFYFVEDRTGAVYNTNVVSISIAAALKPGAGNIEGSKAKTGAFTVINTLAANPATGTSFSVIYDTWIVGIAVTTAMTTDQIAQQIADDVNADTSIELTATATGSDVEFEEKRIGTFFNGEEVTINVAEHMKPGDTPPVAAAAEWEMTDNPTAFGVIEIRNEFNVNDLCLIHVDGTDTISDVISRLADAFNGITTDPKVIDTDIVSPITASIAGTGDIIRLTADDDGADGNDFVFRLTFSSGAISGAPVADFMGFDGDKSGQIIKQFTGGVDGTLLEITDPTVDTLEGGTDIGDAILDSESVAMAGGADGSSGTPGTIVQDYKLIDTIEPQDPEFHGREVILPNSVEQIESSEDFTGPAAIDIRERVDLFDYIVPAVPYEMPLIYEQARIKNRAPIQRLIVDTFDSEKATMRLKVQVFTDRNIQVGYIATGLPAAEYDFEVIGEGVPIQSKFSAWRVENNTIYQSADGIYNLSGTGYKKIIDRYQYPFLSKDLTKVVYNQFHKEYWLFFDDEKILVTSSDGQIRKRFSYPAGYGDAAHGAELQNTLYGAHGTGLYVEELPGQTDGATDIHGILTTTHIGPAKNQVRILEVAVSGQGLEGNINIDLQRERLERNNDAWQPGFIADIATTPENLYIHGVPFTFTHRAVMPKIQLEIFGNSTGFVSHVLFTHIILENKGKSR